MVFVSKRFIVECHMARNPCLFSYNLYKVSFPGLFQVIHRQGFASNYVKIRITA